MSLKICFGPYEAHGAIRHKTQKLHGILTRLAELGYDVELVPTRRLNTLTVHMRDKLIYRCDLRYLQFNIDLDDDPVAQTLVKSVEETRAMFDDDQNVPKFGVHKRVLTTDTHDLLSDDVSLWYEIPYTWAEAKIRKAHKHPSISTG
ncbi:hypothetical protein MTP99_011058 [Tenebrio molitor]|uniref:UPF0728 protein C10orf53 homolog n=1 Tax=Tenebrio molitor TaxID=7067 RepID=UPI001C3B744C|nr:hypothetical protein MTP99_011058 [Tenebrio molitor]CAH1369643.1 unnamed protein product [Tenebrio molitor]